MKSTTKSLLSAVVVAFLVVFSLTAGCSKKIAVDTSKLDYSFQGADEATQSTINEAVDAVDKRDYSGALEKLKKLQADPKLTAEQKSAVDAVIQQIEKH